MFRRRWHLERRLRERFKSESMKSRPEIFLPKRGKAVGMADVDLPPRMDVDFHPR
jgi:hypothetical protein